MTETWIKATRIVAVLTGINRAEIHLQVEDVLNKCSEEELNFYYYKLVGGKHV